MRPRFRGAQRPATARLRRAAAQAARAAPARRSSSQRSTRNFEVDRTLSYVKQPVGNLKRLSVGVVLDDWQKVDADGKVTTSPMSEADIKRFTPARARIDRPQGGSRRPAQRAQSGLQEQRARSRRSTGRRLWQTPWVTQLAKQIVGAALVLVVAFLVLRPLMKSLTKSSPRRGSARRRGDLAGDRVSISGQGGKPIKLAPSFEQQIAAARTLVGQDPKRAAQVVKDWVSADG